MAPAPAINQERLDGWRAKLAANTVRSDAGCLLWMGYRQPNGYGWINGTPKIAAHRAALIVSGQAIPAGMDVCHKCDVRNCVEPKHLYAGSRRQNMADCSRRHRHNKPVGSSHWMAKLSDVQVREIRALRDAGEGVVSIAQHFNISHGTVSRIARRVWRGAVA